jgi:hypothetical protein
MIAPNLYADLIKRGALVTVAETPKSGELPPLRVRVRAPQPLPESLALAVIEHKAELLQFVFELEEAAAMLEFMQENSREESDRMALSCVRGGTATGDGAAYLRAYAERELGRLGVLGLLEPSERWEVKRVA